MDQTKKVMCVTDGCRLNGVVYEVPYSMLMSIDEAVRCGACSLETETIVASARQAEQPAVNADQVAAVLAMDRPEFFGLGPPVPGTGG